MADDSSSVKDQTKRVVTEISYCPKMGVYRHKQVDGKVFFFDNDMLVSTIDKYMRGGHQRQADFMVILTGMARKFPHQLISFDAEGNTNLSELVEQKSFDEGPDTGTAPSG